jgi:hypothetical protein
MEKDDIDSSATSNSSYFNWRRKRSAGSIASGFQTTLRGTIAALRMEAVKVFGVKPAFKLRFTRTVGPDDSKYLPVEQLALSPQCGFGGAGLGTVFDQDVQWRKFERMLETAHQVWDTL